MVPSILNVILVGSGLAGVLAQAIAVVVYAMRLVNRLVIYLRTR